MSTGKTAARDSGVVSLETTTTAKTELPKFLVLNASVLESREELAAVREYVRADCIEFEFPEGLAAVPVLEECRALCDLENFDVLYDLTMQYLTGKSIVINMVDPQTGTKKCLGATRVANKMADLRVMQCVVDYPWLVFWLTEFMAAHLSKKFPLPIGKPREKAAKKKKQGQKQSK